MKTIEDPTLTVNESSTMSSTRERDIHIRKTTSIQQHEKQTDDGKAR